jgi:hypothetical protein
MGIAAIGESLHKFDELVTKGILQGPTENDVVMDEAWEFIQSVQVRELKRTNLKYMRDKSSFHFDPEPIKQYFSEASKLPEESDLWETTNSDTHGFSPLASLLISNTLLNVTKPHQARADLSIKVYGALNSIVLSKLDERFNLDTTD